MNKIIRIKGTDYPVPFFRIRDEDLSYGRRSTVTIVTDLEYAAVVALFSEPGEWFAIMQYENDPDIVKDCTAFDQLLSIKDNRTGVLEVVMGKITAEEALAELLEALNT